MKNLKLVLHHFEGMSEDLPLPEAVNELFINNKKNKEDTQWVLNIGTIRINGLSDDTDLNFGQLKSVWEILTKKINQELVKSIDVYNNDYLLYTISNIKSVSYVIDFLGNSLGERIGVNFDY